MMTNYHLIVLLVIFASLRDMSMVKVCWIMCVVILQRQPSVTP